ncbi:MAG: ABC transporter substrate-binding protein [Acidimicrobiia bacterium]
MRSRITRLWALLFAAVLVVAACSPAGTGADTTESDTGGADTTQAPEPTESPEPEDDTIRIGGLGPLSEPGTVNAGIDMQWAMELAVADINAAGGVLGKQLELFFEDTQNLPDVAAAVAKKLVEEVGVHAVVGEYHSGAALGAIPTFNESGTPVVFSETWNDKITGGDPEDPDNLPAQPPTVFRIAPTSTYASNFAIDWLVNGIGASKVVQVFEATDFGIGQNESLLALLEGTGIAVEAVQVELNQPDYSTVLTRLAEEHGDADVVIFDVTGDSSYVAEQNAIDVGLIDDDTICFANQVAQNSDAFWAAVPDGVGCVFRFVGPAPSAYNDLTASVAERYRAEFGQEPAAWVFEAYDSVLLVADAIERAGSTDAAAIVAALETTSFLGAQGQYEFPYGSENTATPADKPWLWHQWPQPAISMLQYTEAGQSVSDAAIVWPEAAQTHGTAYIPVDR